MTEQKYALPGLIKKTQNRPLEKSQLEINFLKMTLSCTFHGVMLFTNLLTTAAKNVEVTRSR